MAEIENGFIVLNDVRLEYRSIINNSDANPTLVFLHEGLGSVSMWKEFPQQLADQTGLNAFVYSRQSYGKSSPLAEARDTSYLHREAQEILPRLLEAANIDKHVLIGHSDGASIALLYAASNLSVNVEALVLLAPHVFNEDLSVRSITAARKAYEESDLRERLGVYHDDVDNTFWRWNDIWLDKDFRDWNIESCLPDVKVPVLLMQGKDDEYGTLAQVDAIKKQCTGKVDVLMLDDCAHTPFRDQPQASLQAMVRFIQQLEFN